MEKIGIFCSASDSIDQTFFDAAHQIGEWMGRNGKTLIYGGANLGLMECVAKAVKESGGRVIGVVPSKLEENGKVSTYLDEMIRTHNLSDRKDNNENNALGMAKTFLHYHKYESSESVFRRIEALTAEGLLEVANEMFAEEYLSTLIYR